MAPERPRFAEAPAALAPDASEVHVWWLGAAATDAASTAADWSLLDDAERQRAQRYRDRAAARAYIHSHARLREVLARYLHAGPAVRQLRHSLSRSGPAAVAAVTAGVAVGVDIEDVRAAGAATDLPWPFVHDRLPAQLRDGLGGGAGEPFCLAWTRLEAYAKAIGTGLAALPAGDSTPVACRSFRVGDRLVGSVVTGGPDERILRTFAAAPLETA